MNLSIRFKSMSIIAIITPRYLGNKDGVKRAVQFTAEAGAHIRCGVANDVV